MVFLHDNYIKLNLNLCYCLFTLVKGKTATWSSDAAVVVTSQFIQGQIASPKT